MVQSKLNDYYSINASEYNKIHVCEGDEHFTALEHSKAILSCLEIESVLDVGCGTGRALGWYHKEFPRARLAGVDMSAELMDLAKQAVPDADFHEADGEALPFADCSFDLVVSTGIMHHVDNSRKCISEICRVARKAVLISDHNNFAFGGSLTCRLRMCLYALNLFKLAAFVKQGFKKQGYSKDDGWWYPYSLLNDLDLISKLTKHLLIIPTRKPIVKGSLTNFLVSQSHLAVVAFK